MSASMFFGVIGIILAIIEIWRPRLSTVLEVAIGKQVGECEAIQTLYLKELTTISKLARGAFREVQKGPQFITPEEFKANSVTSLMNIRTYLWFYWVTAVNFLILRPLYFALIALNKLGRGRAVGGLGVVIAVLSTFS
ncbi:hypothetical protein [Pseudomonas sp. DSP3-2-2]|uniref:hypothetical protein n=1 Tax=unclassified Pseudomonas TaxID=196821 RepID=UPI003CED011E